VEIPKLEDILEFLPRTNCQKCGMTCAEFAEFLLSGDLSPSDCPVLHEQQWAGYIEALEEILAPLKQRASTGMVINPDLCNGCGICVSVCEYNTANSESGRLGKGPEWDEKVAIRVIDGVLVLADESLCTRTTQAADKCTKCKDHCPTNAIDYV